MKAILLVRVSTEAQDFTEQEREIYQMAINDGYRNALDSAEVTAQITIVGNIVNPQD